MARVLVLGLVLAGLVVPGCTSNTLVGAPRSFNRPERIAFVCFDLGEPASPRPVPLEECRPTSLTPDGAGRQTFVDGRRLHVLVTQVTRGEVAAADLTSRIVLDSDRRIPGATFVPVGGTPTDVVVPEQTPTCAWVSTSADWAVTAIPTLRFRPEHDASVPDQVTRIELPAPPMDLALSPDERTLWVALPEAGAVARIAIDPETCIAGAPDLVELDPTVPVGVLAPAQDDCTGDDLCRVCPLDFAPAALAPVAPRIHTPLEPSPRPRVLELDAETGVLLVGDENLPLVHRIELATGSRLAPLSVGAPVRDLALSPWVPDSYALPSVLATPPRSRFLYAIDDLDGSVMAVAYGDEASPNFGAVLAVDGEHSDRPDRIVLPVGARAVEVITPGFDPSASDPRIGTEDTTDVLNGLCDVGAEIVSPSPAPSVLRGVFVSLAMTDGTVRIIDVYDLDAPCRGRSVGPGSPSTDCASPSNPNDDLVYVRRHRPRTGVFPARFVGVFEGPSISDPSGASLRVQTDGTSGRSPSLATLDCPAGMGGIWPADADAPRLCSQTDPFAAAAETWTLGWQGAIVGTASGSGRLRVDGDAVFLDGRTDFCERGVLSAEAAAGIPAGEPEAGYAGDLLAITTRLPDAVLEGSATCRAVVGIDAVGQSTQPILVPIRRAWSSPEGLVAPLLGRLELAADAPILDASTGAPRAVTLADALACLGDALVTYDVRVQRGYAVSGTRTGFLHRVVRRDAGACELDTAQPRTLVGRAFHGVPFAGRRLAVRLEASVAPVSGTDLRFRIGVHDGRAVGDLGLRVDVGFSPTGTRLLTLPTEVRWNPRTQLLYLVETERRGLLELETRPFRVMAGSRFE